MYKYGTLKKINKDKILKALFRKSWDYVMLGITMALKQAQRFSCFYSGFV
jgi:hypothetical protein